MDLSNNFQNYKKAKGYWDAARGLQKVDGLYTSLFLDGLIEENLTGRKTYEDVDRNIRQYYLENGDINSDQKEADLSAVRIVIFLNGSDFRLTKGELLYTHKFIFEGAFPQGLEKYIGVFRDTNLSKEEEILNGKSVIYTDYRRIEDYIVYDLKEESDRIKKEEITNIEHLARFISNIWNTHPFREGNTRTTAAFVLRYLRKNGVDVNNDMFKDHSVYFRNALALASDNELHTEADYSYLESFLYKLLVDPDAELKKMSE